MIEIFNHFTLQTYCHLGQKPPLKRYRYSNYIYTFVKFTQDFFIQQFHYYSASFMTFARVWKSLRVKKGIFPLDARAVVNETDVVIKVWTAFRLIYRRIQEIPASDDCASVSRPHPHRWPRISCGSFIRNVSLIQSVAAASATNELPL